MKNIIIIGDTHVIGGITGLTDKIIGKTIYTEYNLTRLSNKQKITSGCSFYELTYDKIVANDLFVDLLNNNSTLMIIFSLIPAKNYKFALLKNTLAFVKKEAEKRGIYLALAINNYFILKHKEIKQIEKIISDAIKTGEKNVYFVNPSRYINNHLKIDEPSNIVEFLMNCYFEISFEHKFDLFKIMMKSEEDTSCLEKIIKKEQEDLFEIMNHFEKRLSISIPNDLTLSIFDYLRSDYRVNSNE